MPIGVIVDVLSVLLGGVLGSVIKDFIPEKLKENLPKVFGICAMAMGVGLINNMVNLSAVILAIIVGAIIGELVDIESRVKNIVANLFNKLSSKNNTNMTTAQNDLLITSIVLFCFSGTGIFGALNAGFTGDNSILIAKSVLDFFTAMIFATTVGFAISFISIPQCILLLIVFFSAGLILPLLNADMISDFKACGGIITMAIGLKMFTDLKLSLLNLVPSLILVMVFSSIWQYLF